MELASTDIYDPVFSTHTKPNENLGRLLGTRLEKLRGKE